MEDARKAALLGSQKASVVASYRLRGALHLLRVVLLLQYEKPGYVVAFGGCHSSGAAGGWRRDPFMVALLAK
jgi:hypothetical protein